MEEFDTISGISRYLEDEFSMDQEEVTEMIGMLLESIETQISEIETAVANSDLQAIKEIGHTIKGSAGNIGALHLSDLGKRLEESALDTTLGECSVIISEIKDSLSLLRSSQN